MSIHSKNAQNKLPQRSICEEWINKKDTRAVKSLVDQNLPQRFFRKKQQVLADFQVEISIFDPQRVAAPVKHSNRCTHTYKYSKSRRWVSHLNLIGNNEEHVAKSLPVTWKIYPSSSMKHEKNVKWWNIAAFKDFLNAKHILVKLLKNCKNPINILAVLKETVTNITVI